MFSSSFATINREISDTSHSEIIWGDQIIANENKKRKEEEKEEEEKLRKKQIEEYHKQSQKIKVEYEKCLMDYIKIHGNYWQHPQIDNCYIPIKTKNVLSLDKVNRISLWLQGNGEYSTPSTLLGRIGGKDWTKEEYCKLYCNEKIEDGVTKYYFKKIEDDVTKWCY